MKKNDIENLPNDYKALKDMLWDKVQRVELLEHRLSLFQRQRFGASSEKLPGQKQFEFSGDDAVQDLPDPNAEKREEQAELKKSGKPRGRRPLPPDLPREKVVHDLPESERQCACCGAAMKKIGEEVSEVLDFVPAIYRVLQHVRPKYACQSCHEGVKTAPPAPKVVEQGIASAGVVASVIVDKFDDHLPLYRQSERFARIGIDISRSTLCDWAGQGAERMRPIWDWMRRNVVKSRVIWTDDTTVKVLEPGRGKTRTARFWVYIGGEDEPWVVFDYTTDRSREGPETFLKSFAGRLQSDAYAGYNGVNGKAIGCGCWAHARRKFFDAKETDPRALEMLALIGALYAVETLARPFIEEAMAKPETERAAALAKAYGMRLELRQLKARPVLERIAAWLAARKADALPKSPLGMAIGYASTQRERLARYLENGEVEIDNNISERILRSVAIGRKNYLFVGNDASGERAAILYSIIETCKRHGVNPFEYMKDVLIRISTHPASRIEELMPHNWKRLFGEAAQDTAGQPAPIRTDAPVG